VPALHRLAAENPAAPYQLVAVVTTPGRPAGRNGTVQSSPVEAAARAAGVGVVLTPARLRDPAAVASIQALAPDLVVLADDGRIVPEALLGFRHGSLNLHPSLLPRHRGPTPIPAAILAGDPETGVTIIRMDAGVDTGPIVTAERLSLDGTETAPELEARLAGLAAELLELTIRPWIDGSIEAVPQAPAGATLTHRFRRDDGRLDPGQPAAILERRVRALQPWPGTWFTTARGLIAIHRASVAQGEAGDQPGTIVAAGSGIALATADGRLVVEEAQPASGRRMTGPELRRGRPWLLGAAILAA
jgi:methionyl-tRNA formyltransferase